MFRDPRHIILRSNQEKRQTAKCCTRESLPANEAPVQFFRLKPVIYGKILAVLNSLRC